MFNLKQDIAAIVEQEINKRAKQLLEENKHITKFKVGRAAQLVKHRDEVCYQDDMGINYVDDIFPDCSFSYTQVIEDDWSGTDSYSQRVKVWLSEDVKTGLIAFECKPDDCYYFSEIKIQKRGKNGRYLKSSCMEPDSKQQFWTAYDNFLAELILLDSTKEYKLDNL